MVTQVARHEFPTDRLARAVDVLGEGAQQEIEHLETSPLSFGSAINGCLTAAQVRCIGDVDAEQFETWDAFVTAMQTAHASFAAASEREGTVECRIGHKVRTLQATGPRPYTHPGNWLTAFWLAIVCREQDRIDQLCGVPLDLLRASGAEFDEYVYHWVDALQTWRREDDGLVDKLTATFETSRPEIARIAGQELMDKILYQPINLFYRYVRNDRPGFNEALKTALLLHREYWTANDERATDITGVVALGPLAITCLAYDAGFPVEVESEYLPRDLVRRAWVGEFET